ncbi:hypothetical protein D3C84_785620 [compost metagenome]
MSLIRDLGRGALGGGHNASLLHALVVRLKRDQLGAQLAQPSDAEAVHQLGDAGIGLAATDRRGQGLLQAVLLRSEIASVDAGGLQLGALVAHLGLLALELSSGGSKGLLSLGVFPAQPLDRLAGLFDSALEIVDPLLGLEVGRTRCLGGLLGFPEGIDLTKWPLNSLDQFHIFFAKFFGCTARLGSVGGQFDFILGHGHSLRHLRKNRHG